MLTYWSFHDALLQTYLPQIRLLPRVVDGTVYLVMLERREIAAGKEEQARIREALACDRIVPVFLRYRRFGVGALMAWAWYVVRLMALILRKRVDAIHAVCTPAGAAGYVLSMLSGRPLVVDSYEPHAEAMVENGTWERTGVAFRLLFALETLQSRRASVLIGLTESMRGYARAKYGVEGTPFVVKPLCIEVAGTPPPDEDARRATRRRLGVDEKVVGVYAGKFGGIYYDEELFRLIRAALDVWDHRFHMLLLTPTSEAHVRAGLEKYGVNPAAVTIGFKPHREVLELMRAADFAVNPVKPVPSKRHCTSIKDGEYWAAGLPVIIPPGISDDSDIIAANRTGVIWADVSDRGCHAAIREMQEVLGEQREVLASRIRQQATQFRSLEIAERAYSLAYAPRLLTPRLVHAGRH